MVNNPYNHPLFYLIMLWSIFWQGVALWRAAQHKQRNWFIVLLIFSSAGILDLLYLFKFSKKPLTWKEIKTWRYFFVERVKEKE